MNTYPLQSVALRLTAHHKTRFRTAGYNDSRIAASLNKESEEVGSDLTRFMNSGEGDATARGGAPYGEDAQLGASREEAIDLSPTPHGTPLSKPYLIDEKTERRSSIRSSFAQFHALDSLRLSPSNHSRNTSRASHRSTSADHGISQLERQDSMIPDATTWQIRSDEQLDFETMLLSYSLERGQATLECKESGMGDGALKMYLYRTQCAYAWEVTRRLVIVDPDAETQTTRIQSFWLPLADISIRLYDDTFELAWSDCDHDFQEPTKNYVETHSKKYDCNRPNNSIRLKVASSASNNVLGLVQAFCSPLASVRGVSSPPNQQMSLLGGEKVGMFNTMREKQDPILMIVGSLTQGTTTKVYTVPRQMDLRIIMHKDSSAGKKLFQTVITGLGATTYISDAQNMSKMMQRKGTFQKAAQESRKAVFTFAETLSLFDFLEAVTGWELLFFSRLRSVKERRTLSHDLGPGEMMIWQRGGGRGRRRAKQEIVMTYRLDGDGVHGMWISGHMSSNNVMKKNDGTEISIHLRGSTEGDRVEMEGMRAVSTSRIGGDSIGRVANRDQLSKFRAVFNNAQDVAEYQNVVKGSMQVLLSQEG